MINTRADWIARTAVYALLIATPRERALTIGEHFKLTRALSQCIVLPLGVLYIAAVDLFLKGIPEGLNILALLGLPAAFEIGWLFFKPRCPHCKTDFTKERIAKLGRWSFNTRGTWKLWNACPRCGVSDPWR